MKEFLHLLAEDHPKRNTPLSEIGAEICSRHGSTWRPIAPQWKIAKSTFNELAAWYAQSLFRA